jgi:drug/metabolite transporter (DMT)-like permease
LLLLILGTLRGGATSLSKYVSINDVPPLAYSMWQSLIACSILIPMGYLQSRQLPPLLRHSRYFLFCALVGVAIPNVIFFYVVRSIPAGTMAVLLTLGPIVTYALVVSLRMERARGWRVAGILLGLGGALMLAMPRLDPGIELNWWVLVGTLCPLGYATTSVYIARYPVTDSHLFLLAGGSHLVAFMFLLPATLVNGDFFWLWQDPGLAELLIVCHGVIAAVAYSLFFKIVALAGPVYYSFSTYLIAVTGIAWGWVIFGETHPQHFWLAVGLIFVGLGIINFRRTDPASRRRDTESAR